MSKDIDDILDGLPDTQDVIPFNNDRFCGFDIAWMKKGVGFGHLTIAFDKENNRFSVDTERGSQQSIAEILCASSFRFAEELLKLEAEEEKARQEKK